MVTDERLRPEQVARRLAGALELPPAGPGAPRVSCVLVGGDPAATARAIRLFAEQDYPERELVLVLPGGEGPGGRVAEHGGGAPVRTVAVPRGAEASAARDAGCAAARGPLIALWESDTWYPAWRLRYQAAALSGTGWELSATASAVVWDPVAGESWVGDAAPWFSPPVLFGATICLTRQAWAARSLAARGGAVARAGGHFVLGLPGTAFHVPRGAHLAVLVRPGGHQPEAGHAAYPRGSAELLLGAAAALDWGTGPSPAVRRPAPPVQPASPVPVKPGRDEPGAGRVVPGEPAPDEPAPPRARPVAPVALGGTARPLVSCVMPTFNRRRFVEQALRKVARQDYRQLELVVVDDGSEPIEDLLAGLGWARYVRLGERATIGRKRDIACETARGDVIVQWDDDDWYGPQRVSRQVEDIVRGTADVSGIGINLMLEVRTMQLWSTREQAAAAPRYAPVDSLAGGTLAFTRDCWREVGGYPDASVGEDLGLLRRFADAGARIQGVSNRDAYVYIRHGRNSWRFDFTPDDGPAGWRRSDGFGPLTTEDLAFYASLDSAGTLEAADSAATPDTRPDADPEAVPTGSAADAD
ncbi:glycosyltransferase family 2 protein [Kitasatospora sp. CM 4170]|uniref:Glycosyltransferase family 2 protein n=1 Tax=Kitasatospora aburaviensis TaxID=67265 RepID=A0ABW1ES85_9ACTN|nr:glycosyltransferase family 2 protein [Kitasatospora sp. CM 4170]WNM44581.1 glycosyltransferase family 2 protein [Kitasatospora sp. CM 4170]